MNVFILIWFTNFSNFLGSKFEDSKNETDFNQSAPDLIVFCLADLEIATNIFSFENKLGEGGYGPVYKVKFTYLII